MIVDYMAVDFLISKKTLTAEVGSGKCIKTASPKCFRKKILDEAASPH
jgi:hypothetical protein